MKYQYFVSYQFTIGSASGFGMTDLNCTSPVSQQVRVLEMAKAIERVVAENQGVPPSDVSVVILNWRRLEEEDRVAPALLEALYAMGKAGARYDNNHPLRKAWEGGRKALGLEEDEAWQ